MHPHRRKLLQQAFRKRRPGGCLSRSRFDGERWKWLETIAPLIGSAGWLGHHAITLLRSPFCPSMFQIALVVRDKPLINLMSQSSGRLV
jgi:hypothetical protein